MASNMSNEVPSSLQDPTAEKTISNNDEVIDSVKAVDIKQDTPQNGVADELTNEDQNETNGVTQNKGDGPGDPSVTKGAEIIQDGQVPNNTSSSSSQNTETNSYIKLDQEKTETKSSKHGGGSASEGTAQNVVSKESSSKQISTDQDTPGKAESKGHSGINVSTIDETSQESEKVELSKVQANNNNEHNDRQDTNEVIQKESSKTSIAPQNVHHGHPPEGMNGTPVHKQDLASAAESQSTVETAIEKQENLVNDAESQRTQSTVETPVDKQENQSAKPKVETPVDKKQENPGNESESQSNKSIEISVEKQENVANASESQRTQSTAETPVDMKQENTAIEIKSQSTKSNEILVENQEYLASAAESQSTILTMETSAENQITQSTVESPLDKQENQSGKPKVETPVDKQENFANEGENQSKKSNEIPIGKQENLANAAENQRIELTVETPNQNVDNGNDTKARSGTSSSTDESQTSNIEKLDPVMKTVYLGFCPFSDLPPLSKKIVRIFVSSTFSDTKEERNALMQNVYPRLAQYCREKHGLEFQVVDMRWGVPEQAADNHSTTDLCIHEIHKCRDVSVGPCFVAIIGNKYGYRPIPTEIEEHLFQQLAQVAGDDADWQQIVSHWYLRDDNAQPVVYVLQPISTKIPEVNDADKDKQREAWKLWDQINTKITSCLRRTSATAHGLGKITDEQQHVFYMSVTENEITHGIFRNDEVRQKDTSLCIMRRIPDINQHLDDPKAPKFIDLELNQNKAIDNEAQSLLGNLKDQKIPSLIRDGNLTQMDIEWSASGARITLEDMDGTNTESQSSDHIAKHKSYLEGVCTDFFQRISQLIDKGGIAQNKLYTELTSEILQHFHLGRGRCEVFEGRADIIQQAKSYLEGDCNVPLTIYGKSGSGKTSVMAKILEHCCNKDWLGKDGKPYVTIVRFLGTTPRTSNLIQLLDSLCAQLSIMCGKEWEVPEKFKDYLKTMNDLMKLVSTKHSIVLLLDSIDQLMPAYNAYLMKWLPDILPPGVKIIISTIPEGYPVLDSMKEIYAEKGGKFIEVLQLGEQLGLAVIMKWLSLNKRTTTKQQTEVIKHALEKCSLPLYARIAYDHIRKWRSYDTPTLNMLEVTVKGCINQLFQAMEKKFGEPLVQHSLSYMTASRHGLSEVELEHLMSLDDILLNQIYKFWRPPIRRIPPLLWTRIRSEINSYIVERSADDIIVLSWYHRQFIEATKEKYLSDSNFSNMIHSNMVDYFLGKWGGGKPKPFEYTEHQMKRFGLSDSKASADRKVPLQPYVIHSTTSNDIWVNKRKLFELPFHLVKCKEYDLMKEEVMCNYEWLFATLKGSSATTILDEFDIFMKADKMLRKDPNLKTLAANMRLVRPYITKHPNSLSYELSGRLAKYVSISPLISKLIRQCDTTGVKNCPIVPMMTCFETADLGLKQNINYRSSETWQEGGCMTCSKDFKTMYILDVDDNGITSKLTSWDIETGEVLRELPVLKEHDGTKADLYFQIILDPKEEFALAFHRAKYFASTHRDRYYGNGMVDIIRLSDGEVVKHISEYLHKEEFSNPLLWMTPNWCALKFGPKSTIFHLYDDKRIDMNRPNALSQDELHFLVSQASKANIREFESKKDCGEFDHEGSILSTAIAEDKSVVLLGGPELGEIRVYDLTKKSLNPEKQYGFLIKPKCKITIPNSDKEKLTKLMRQEVNSEKLEMRVQLIISRDFGFAVGVYQNLTSWIAYIYSIFQGRRLGSYVGQIGNVQSRHIPYPQFSHDSQYVVLATATTIEVYACENGQKVNEYEINQGIKDFHVSPVSDQIATMSGKDISILSVERSEDDKKSNLKRGGKKMLKSVEDLTFLPREEKTNGMIEHEIVINQSEKGATIEEVEGAAYILDTDTIASARSKRKFAIDTRYTPDGLKAVQLHSRVQVVDMQQEEIKYTPQSGDTITRTIVNEGDGSATSETIQIPSGTNRSEMMEMKSSDRIVNENNKVKFRITSAGKNRTRIMSVPSIVTVYSATEAKLKRLKRFTVFQENMEAISNRFLVTDLKKSTGDFINIYDLEQGKLLSTHQVQGGFGCATFTPSEDMLIIVSQVLDVKMYEYPNFSSCESSINVQTDPDKSRWSVRWVKCNISNGILQNMVIHYKPQGAMGVFRYMLIDAKSKKTSNPLVLTSPLEDFSADGLFSIDAKLVLYDMEQGSALTTVPYINKGSKMRLHVRLTDDCKHVIFIDRVDDTLHVVRKVGPTSFQHIASCFTHAPKMEFFGGLTLRCKGNVISIRSVKDESIIFLRLVETEDTKTSIEYDNEAVRALSLVPDSPGLKSLMQQRKDDSVIKTLLLEKAQKSEIDLLSILTEEEFVQKFRLRKDTVRDLIDILKPELIQRKNTIIKKDALSVQNQVLVALRFYATGNPESKLHESINISGSTMLYYIDQVSYALEAMHKQYIRFTLVKQNIQQMTDQFEAIAHFPRVCAIVDAIHIKLDKFKENTNENPAPYINTAGYHSINTQLACDAQHRFIDVFAHFKGTMTDAEMFRNTMLNKVMDQNSDKFQCLLLGDAAYPCLRYLLTPIKNASTQPEEAYNLAHELTMKPMHRTVSLWRARFPGLSLGLDVKPDVACAAIVATCILHNMALDKGEPELTEDVVGEKQPGCGEEVLPTSRGEQVRKQIMQTNKLGQR